MRSKEGTDAQGHTEFGVEFGLEHKRQDPLYHAHWIVPMLTNSLSYTLGPDEVLKAKSGYRDIIRTW